MPEKTRTTRVEFYPTEEVQTMLEHIESRRRSSWINEAISAYHRASVQNAAVITNDQIENIAKRISERLEQFLKNQKES